MATSLTAKNRTAHDEPLGEEMNAENKEYIKEHLKSISEMCEAATLVVFHSNEEFEGRGKTEEAILKVLEAIDFATHEIGSRIKQ